MPCNVYARSQPASHVEREPLSQVGSAHRLDLLHDVSEAHSYRQSWSAVGSSRATAAKAAPNLGRDIGDAENLWTAGGAQACQASRDSGRKFENLTR